MIRRPGRLPIPKLSLIHICIDGHNFSDLEAALTHARTIKKRPTAIIMATVKGKGLSVAEGKLSSHNMPLSPEDVAAALQELQ